jgi:sialate O-acetylesterase
MKELFFSPIISDGMIIQRDKHFPIRCNKMVTITFLEKTYKSDYENETWLITLDPVKTGGPYEMQITYNNQTIFIKDIYAGDVWLCAGQSNMEMQMQRLIDDFDEEWKNADDYSLIRQFKVSQQWDFASEREDLTDGSWVCASSKTLHDFSGTAWFFAKNLYDKYKIPIGLIMTAWGGTPIESWMSKDALCDFPSVIAESMQYAAPSVREKITKDTSYGILEWETNLKHEDVGLVMGWEKSNTDISEWENIILPSDFADTHSQKNDLSGFCGVIWLAKDFYIENDFALENAKVWLGTIIDADTVYINGHEIGNTSYRYPPRKYNAGNLLNKGNNRIVIKVTCNNGQGGITKDKPFKIFTDNETIELAGEWKYNIGVKSPARMEEFFFQRKPIGNFNAMIAPVLKFPLKGVIWYQGESNESAPHEYAQLFKLMIQDWRKRNNECIKENKELFFLFVQLPVLGNPSDNNEQHNWPVLRESQKSALSLPNTAMAVALELGEWNDIHPLNKKDVGYRLFIAAEKAISGVDNTSPGPTIKKIEFSAGKTDNKEQKIILSFDNCGNGLQSLSSGTYVSVIGNEEQIRLPALITGTDEISIDVSSVKNPKKILYAWADNPRDMQLINSDGLPVLPFKIDLI